MNRESNNNIDDEVGKSINGFFKTRSFGKVAYGLDIGGTLTKMVYFQPSHCSGDPEYMERVNHFIEEQSKIEKSGVDESYSIYIDSLGGCLHFIKFQSAFFMDVINLVKKNGLSTPDMLISGTGGGSFKYEQSIQSELGCTFYKEDELECLVRGMAFIQENNNNECYTYIPTSVDNGDVHCIKKTVEMKQSPYPFLLVNIGSGVSILKVESEHVCERVGGSGIGGATFLGLATLLTGVESFEEAINLASKGSSNNVDMLVKDIYGGDYLKFNLKGNTVASNFGKLVRETERKEGKKDEDICRGLLNMRLGIDRIIFSGNFLHKNKPAMYLITNSLRYWSAGIIKALFLEHEGYCGCVGSLLCRIDKYIDQYLDSLIQGNSQYRNSDLELNSLKRRLSIDLNLKYNRDTFSVTPNNTGNEDDVDSVDMDTHARVCKLSSYNWRDNSETVTIFVSIPDLSESLSEPKVRLNGGSRFISLLVHIQDEYIYTLRIPVLYASIDSDTLDYEIENNTIYISAVKKEPGEWPRLELFIKRKEGRSQSLNY
ncbi:hypothetical protein WA158_001682 [Blastocystis sp. Blastoise]